MLALALLGAAPPPEVVPLVPGAPVEQELAAGESHRYSVDVPAGHFLQVTVEQRGVDVKLRLLDAAGREITKRDGPYGRQRTEALSEVVAGGGLLLFEVFSAPPAAGEPTEGSYLLALAPLRPATTADAATARAESLFYEALVAAFELGDLSTALATWDRAIPFWREAGDAFHEAETWYWSGFAADVGNRPEEAIPRYRQALLYEGQAPEREADLLFRLGLQLYDQGQSLEARNAFSECLPLAEHLSPIRRARLLTNLGALEADLGDYQTGLTYLRRALEAWDQQPKDHHEKTAALNNLGRTYSRLGDYETALRFYEEALERNRTADDREWVAKTLHNIGWVHFALEDLETARTREQEALLLARVLTDRELEATILENLSRIELRAGALDPAEDLLRAALDLRLALGDRRAEAVARQDLARLLLEKGPVEAAEAALRRSSELAADERDPTFLARAKVLAARLAAKHGRFAEAVDEARQGLDLLESLRGEVVQPDLQMTFLAAKHEYYEHVIQVAMDAHRVQPKRGFDVVGYTFHERARARGLLDSLRRMGIDTTRGVDPALVAQERELRAEIHATEIARGRDPGSPELTEKLEDLLLELRRVRGEMRRQSQPYSVLTEPQPLDLAEVQSQVLDAESLLLEYSLGRERSFLWAVTDRTVRSFELPPRAEIDELARHAHRLLSTASARRDSPEWRQVAHELSRILVQPARELLGQRRLVVVPDGALHYLPFAVLPDPKRPEQPLILRHDVIHEPSASAVAVLRERIAARAPPPHTLAIFADPVFYRNDSRLAPAGTETRESAATFLPRLPHSKVEAETILAMVPPSHRWLLMGPAATPAAVLQGPLDEYRILHFATHSRIDESHPELSSIALSFFDESGEETAGHLRLQDLYALTLRADLVTLSACETALGQEVRGEGLIGLTRGFFHAGAARVLASLWSIDDRTTAVLMSRLYEEVLRHGRSPAEALAATQREFATGDSFPEPHQWGGLVLQGEWW